MPYTHDQYAALCEALAKGVRRIRYSTGPGQMDEVEYASLDAMRSLKAEMELELGIATKTAARPRTVTLRPVRPRR